MSQTTAIIKRLRCAPYSLSQTEISRRTGIPQSRVSRWESGYVAASADDALRLAQLEKDMGSQKGKKPRAGGRPLLDFTAAKDVA